jgi:hypothetical protein
LAPPAEVDHFWQAVERAFEAFETPSGCVVPAQVLVASGARPRS